MAAFEVAAALLTLGGAAAVAWLLLPRTGATDDAAPPPPAEPEDRAQRLQALSERALRPDDPATPWEGASPLVAVGERLPSWLRPWQGLALLEGGTPALLPLNGALIELVDAPDVLLGRRQGRPLHLIRLEGDVYLDLVEALRLLPPILVELEARGHTGTVRLHADARSLGADPIELVAPWLVGEPGPRVVPEGDGARTLRLTIAGRPLTLTAWMPAVAAGLRDDRLAWAGVIEVGGERCVGATPPSTLEALGLPPGPAIGWTRDELLELAALLTQLERQQVDLSPLLLDLFADRTVPIPHDPDQATLVTAVLNWVGAAHRAAGRPRAALAALDAARSVCHEGDDDQRGDLEHNAGLAWMDLRGHVPDALDRALGAFDAAARAHPGDPTPWIERALIFHLRGQPTAEREAWEQATARAQGTDLAAALLANAEAAAPR